MTRSVLITGRRGGIGQSLAKAFSEDGWNVIGVDRRTPGAGEEDANFINADIGDFARNPQTLLEFRDEVLTMANSHPLAAIINNAAVQHLGELDVLSADAIVESLAVNAVAPMLLAKTFLPELKSSKGSILNIGSVHAQATKPGFSAYATSKAALHGMTRALAVDLGPDVRVNTLAPAATATPMLKAGFEKNEAALKALKNVHPMKRIAETDEIARIALFLVSPDASFLTGATLYADGGVLSRLHDPA
ncbi:MAG: SDR family oxidoreductase [Pseudomonadota bacterium]